VTEFPTYRIFQMKKTRSVAECIRKKIEKSEEAYWMYDDFSPHSVTAVSKTLSRMVQEGTLERVSKGVYYRPRMTRFGRSHPCQSEIQQIVIESKSSNKIHPSGVSAANLLGFTTQNSVQGEFATSASSASRQIIGSRARLHTRRPSTWDNLSRTEASLLDFLRFRGELSDFSPEETKNRLLNYFREESCFEKFLEVVDEEPPRVRAMLGAIGQELGESRTNLKKLREGLNPVSRFDFGKLRNLRYAKEWQAK
jgi:Family of unknown function (DUF6088)